MIGIIHKKPLIYVQMENRHQTEYDDDDDDDDDDVCHEK